MTTPNLTQPGRRYCGRVFSPEEFTWIREQIQLQTLNRAQLSRRICEQFTWRKTDGGLKDMSCRVALLRMEADGLLTLPRPLNTNSNGKPYGRRTVAAEPGSPVCDPVSELKDLILEPVIAKTDSHLWNEYIDRYHYLGYQPLPGAQLRYFAKTKGQIVALLGFGAAAWTTAPRDRFIGWTHQQRKAKLHLIINNARFLVLPWVNSRHMASRLLAMAARRLPNDWASRYGYRPVLLETFVEKERFKGTCYKAANWVCLGETQGRGKLGDHNVLRSIKAVWVFPLARNFQNFLTT